MTEANQGKISNIIDKIIDLLFVLNNFYYIYYWLFIP